MKKETAIYSKLFESYVWIRPEGRGTFVESSLIKELVDQCVAQGARKFVIDLEACPGMDSTFMGMMAGVGIALRKTGGKTLVVVGTSEKTLSSLRELGLHHLLTIEPAEGPWVGRLEDARRGLELVDLQHTGDREAHIRESHEDLCLADEGNFEKFGTVLEMLGSPLKGTAQ